MGYDSYKTGRFISAILLSLALISFGPSPAGADFSYFDAGLTGVDQGSAAWGDYDNDGDLDVLITGDNGSNPIAGIWKNDDGAFSYFDAGLTGVEYGSATWGDYDNDGDLDILITGRDGTYDYHTEIWENDGSVFNTAPDKPSGLRTAFIPGGYVQLSWDPASDEQTPAEGLTYNIRVGSAPGKFDVLAPMADPVTGFRRIPAMGAANHRLFYYLDVDLFDVNGTYYWSVQAVDTAFAGSAWAEEGWFGFLDETLFVEKKGAGSGTVTGDPAGIDCGNACHENYPVNGTVTLTAVPDTTSVFGGWSGGGCNGTGDCTVVMDASKTVTATFDLASEIYHLAVEKSGAGSGTVTGSPPGIDCGADCDAYYAKDRTIDLTGAPDPGSALDGWSEIGCPGNGGCQVNMNRNYHITAIFNPDGDGDGASDVMEDGGPNNGDGNDDGTPDSLQDNVTTFKDINGHYVTLIAEHGTIHLACCTTCPSPEDMPGQSAFPAGFFGFTLQGLTPGQSTQVTLLLHHRDTAVNTYFKYGPTPDDQTDHWYEFNKNDGDLGAVITQEANYTKVVLHFQDGQKGDDDLTANGQIPDIGAPAAPNTGGGGGGGGGGSCYIDALMD